MLALSGPAMAFLGRLLQEADAPPEVAVRLKLQRGPRIALRLDHPAEEDVQIHHAGRMLLLLDRRVHALLSNRQLELHVSPAGEQLSFAPAGE